MGKDKRNSWVTFLFFFITGIAIIIYLNQTPYQVRERDYAYAGSFYAFSIWIGLAVLWIKDVLNGLFKKIKNGEIASAGIASALCIAVAVLMGCQNWDDHDRSNRYTARDIAFNYLETCDPNAIIVTHGDNDTFPLWYAQEVENIRTDVRIVNTSLLGMDWYIDQMRCKMYDSEPLPITIPRKDYLYGINDFIPVYKGLNRVVPIKEVMDIFSDPEFKQRGKSGLIASNMIALPVNKENVKKYGIVEEEDFDKIVDTVTLTISGNTISKTDLIILNILSNYQWDRPFYFVSANGDVDLGLKPWLQYEGMCHKLVPVPCSRDDHKQMVAEKLRNKLMNVYRFDSNKDTSTYADYQNIYTFCAVSPVREMFIRNAESLLAEGKTTEATEVLDRCFEVTPEENYPYNLSVIGGMNELLIIDAINFYLTMDKVDKAMTITDKFVSETIKSLNYYALEVNGMVISKETVQRDIQYIYYLINVLKTHKQDEKADYIMNLIKGL